MVKQPGHFTSMKYEFGVCTNRFNLCLFASTDANGFSRSTSYGDWDGCAREKTDVRGQPGAEDNRRRARKHPHTAVGAGAAHHQHPPAALTPPSAPTVSGEPRREQPEQTQGAGRFARRFFWPQQ
eukprot:SAG22_NODE_2990_length_2045_cov_2.085303_2_plen_124_part_01